jgi:hypothetical protein
MPTALPRIQVTETPTIRRALALAARRWPDAPKSEQLTRMIEIGVDVVEKEQELRRERRMTALLELRRALAGCYPPGYLAELRAEDRE